MTDFQGKCWLAAQGLSGSAQLATGNGEHLFICTHNRTGCPSAVEHKKDNLSQPTFAEAQSACLAEWDYKHNNGEGFYPDHSWQQQAGALICSCCPRGQPHCWRAMPNTRISHDTGCAVCAGQQSCVCNSLEALFPSFAAEFNVDKTGFAPSESYSKLQLAGGS